MPLLPKLPHHPYTVTTTHLYYAYFQQRPKCHPFFFFNDTAPTEIYTLSLHDALPIYLRGHTAQPLQRHHPERRAGFVGYRRDQRRHRRDRDRKSTRLHSSPT